MKSAKDASSTKGKKLEPLKTSERIAKDQREYALLLRRAKHLVE